MREAQQISSGTEARGGAELRLAGWTEFPPAGLLVFQHRTWFPAVDCLVFMLLMEPSNSGRRRGPKGWSWSRGTSR